MVMGFKNLYILMFSLVAYGSIKNKKKGKFENMEERIGKRKVECCFSHFYKEFRKSETFKHSPVSRSTFMKITPNYIVKPKGRTDLCPHCVAHQQTMKIKKIDEKR